MAVKANGIVVLLIICFAVVSCGPARRGLFGEKKTPHERYGDMIRQAGLDKTEMGSMWFMAAARSLMQPLEVTLPFKETLSFSSEEPAASAFVFSAKRGSMLHMTVSTIPLNTKALFAELWRTDDNDSSRHELVSAADSSLILKYEVEKDGHYIIRLQPELLQTIEFTITVTTGPSLAFPVSESGNPKLISFWRDPRDRGARKHEGVDIAAKFRTPAIAAADGHVQRVTDNRLGGKVVFMRPRGKDYVLYYAHLDTQTVSTGQEVTTGQVLGLVGNTGNARNTPPHLHFGIYAFGGAVDPLPFIDPRKPDIREIRVATDSFNIWSATISSASLLRSPGTKAPAVTLLDKGTPVKIIGATESYYHVSLPDKREGFLPGRYLSSKIIRKEKADTIVRLLDKPLLSSPAKVKVAANEDLNIVGLYNNFYLVRYGDITGWLPRRN